MLIGNMVYRSIISSENIVYRKIKYSRNITVYKNVTHLLRRILDEYIF
jgi:hypothetical protein